jgi:hypothetical protein
VTFVKGLLVTGSEDTTFKVFDKGQLVQTYSDQEASVKCFATQGDWLLSAGSSMQAHLLQLVNGQFILKGKLK